jgi:hypothetical protein
MPKYFQVLLVSTPYLEKILLTKYLNRLKSPSLPLAPPTKVRASLPWQMAYIVDFNLNVSTMRFVLLSTIILVVCQAQPTEDALVHRDSLNLIGFPKEGPNCSLFSSNNYALLSNGPARWTPIHK